MKLVRYGSFLFAAAFLLCSCAATIPKPAKPSKRPTMLAAPKSRYGGVKKYPFTVGVLTARDARITPFYDLEDDFFREPIPAGVSDALVNHFKVTSIFNEVRRIQRTVPANPSEDFLFDLTVAHPELDLVLLCDIAKFRLVREKSGGRQIRACSIGVQIALTLQLIHVESGVTVWADQVERINKDMAAKGMLPPEQLGELTRKTLGEVLQDAEQLLLAAGKNMRRG